MTPHGATAPDSDGPGILQSSAATAPGRAPSRLPMADLGIAIVLFVVLVSGNSAVLLVDGQILSLALLAAVGAAWAFRPVKVDRRCLLVVAAFGMLFGAHVASFGAMVLPASAGVAIKLASALLVVRLIPDFARKLVSIMAWIALMSFVFWLPEALGLDVKGLLRPMRAPLPNPDTVHVFLHNFHREGAGRNSGMFWEPGAFAGYLVIMLLLIATGASGRVPRWQTVVLSIALVSTQSTTGYVAGMALLLLRITRSGGPRRSTLRYLIAPVLVAVTVAVSAIAFTQASFLYEKVEHQVQAAISGATGAEINRFGNLVYDIGFIAQRPLTGWSATPQTRVVVDAEVDDFVTHQGNGLSGFLVRFGLVGMAAYLYCVYRVFRSRTGARGTALFGIGILCLVLFGEQFQNFPLFWCLAFLPLARGAARRSRLVRHVPVHSPAGSGAIAATGAAT